MNSPEPQPCETATCCSQFYEQEAVQQLMGDSFHPGGIELTRRLITCLNLPPKSDVADIASGVGTTTRFMANEFGCNATGIDFSQVNVDRAGKRNSQIQAPQPEQESCCLPVMGDGGGCCEVAPGKVKFQQGSADQLPFDDQSLDAVVCECAVSTFADQEAVASEFFRVLKPGGVFAMTDMVVEGELPPDVAKQIAPWTCMANAHRVKGYQDLFLRHGFAVASYVDESDTLLELVSELKRKLVMAGLGKSIGALAGLDLDLKEMRGLLATAKTLVDEGTVQYAAIVFCKGKPNYAVGTKTSSNEACC